MNRSPILSPDGRPMFSAGGRHAWKVEQHRGYVISLEWVGDHKRAQPCIVIWPQKHVFVTGEGNGMWVISRRAITEFVGFDSKDKCTGLASEHCFREAREALPILGKDINDKQAHLALVDCVIRFAPDLVHMPVAPKQVRREMAGEAMWDVAAKNKNTGKTISEASI